MSLYNDSDPMIYLSGLGQFLFDVCLYGFVSHDHRRIMMKTMTDRCRCPTQSTFLVVIINQLGFDRIQSQAMTAPVYFGELAPFNIIDSYPDRLNSLHHIQLPRWST